MRKSKEVRLKEAKELHAVYVEINLERDKRARFIYDMIAKLQLGKSLSTGQRRWLDSLIEEGQPKIVGDKKEIEKITAALEVAGLSESEASALRDFRYKISKGWDLSDKQSAWMNRILEKSDKIAREGPYAPDDDTVSVLRKCVKLSKGYTPVYWSTHGGARRALENVSQWLAGGGYIDEWCVDKLISTMRSRLRELEDKPYANSGDLVWYRSRTGLQFSPGVVSGPPEISDKGDIVYPVLAEGSLLFVTKHCITKRKPREV